ncbi:hypothetical protein, variant [Aphanomyces astaci]|uniref:3'-5' exonuclease domain-containing protein n=1 Tax=Aphanomyces astaci TaxID=112090 RepID=W4FX86_APHAT|nr:hypothetical protein, variant [Aphanomyces astaci]ETV72120.1 hypothetical protein, variant [Aphanomyces astaci]|eukprot:XP_009838563.1 hypothetical protein, variant [Aphanomyces astaci]
MTWSAFEEAAAAGDATAAAGYLLERYTAGGSNAFGICRQVLLGYVKQHQNDHIELLWAMLAAVWSDAASPIAYLLLMALEEVKKSTSIATSPPPSVRLGLRDNVLEAMEEEVAVYPGGVDAKVVVKTIVLCDIDDVDATTVLRYGNAQVQHKDSLAALVQLVASFPHYPWPFAEFLVQFAAYSSWSLAERLIATIQTTPDQLKHLQCTLITLAVQNADLKRAHRWVHQYRLQPAFPELEHILQQEALDKLCSQQKWSLAIHFVGANSTLQVRLFHALVAAGHTSLANDIHDKYALSTLVPKATVNMQSATTTTTLSSSLNNEDGGGGHCQFLVLPTDVSIVLCATDDSMHAFEQAVANECTLSGHPLRPCWLGVDVEWKAVFSKLDSPYASVLQLAVGIHRVFVIDLIALEQSTVAFEILDRVLANPNVLKVGFGLAHDLQVLRGTFPDKGRCFHHVMGQVEIQNVLERVYPTTQQRGGLSSATQVVLGASLDKDQQLSDWTSRPLSTKQLLYAAMDAWCLVRMMVKLAPTTLDIGTSDHHYHIHPPPPLLSSDAIDRVVQLRHAQFTRNLATEDAVVKYMASQPPATRAQCTLLVPPPLESCEPPSVVLANTLCLMTYDTQPHVVVLRQAHKVDLALFAAACGCPRRRVRLATPQECVKVFGYPPGSVPPIAHANPATKIWIDMSVMESTGPVVVGGGLNHVIKCRDGAALRMLCGGELAHVITRVYNPLAGSVPVNHGPRNLCFLSDAHLGRVTKWLRMRGVDIALFQDQGNDRTKFMDQAADEKRIILTTDRKLGQRRRIAAACFVLSSDDPRQQFQEILTHFRLTSVGDVVPRYLLLVPTILLLVL